MLLKCGMNISVSGEVWLLVKLQNDTTYCCVSTERGSPDYIGLQIEVEDRCKNQ